MSAPFVGEIRMFAGDFAPKGWAFCHGQLFPISKNTALFSLLRTRYGGDGKSSFALPDLRGCVPIGPGEASGLSLRAVGDKGGSASVTLTEAELPAHTHDMLASNNQPAEGENGGASPEGNFLAKGAYDDGSSSGVVAFYSTAPANVAMSQEAIEPSGGGQVHDNIMPFLAMSFIIALQGVYPLT